MSKFGEVWVIAEQRSDELQPVSLELLGKGLELSSKLDVGVTAILLGKSVKKAAQELIYHGASKVYLLEDARLRYYQGELYARLIAELIGQHKPEIVMASATTIGTELTPRVAAKVETGLTAHCIDLYIDEENPQKQLVQVVPGWGGNLMVRIICPQRRPQMVTVRPGVLSPSPRDEKRKGKIVSVTPDIKEGDLRVETVEMVEELPREKPLESAKTVVCGGWGMNALGDFSKVQELADVLEGAVAGTRPAMDKGWIKESRLIGQSGKTVSPELFISLGASGAMHYTTGFMGAKFILSVDQNPTAPIFEMSDIGIIGDLRDVLPCLIEEFKKVKSGE